MVKVDPHDVMEPVPVPGKRMGRKKPESARGEVFSAIRDADRWCPLGIGARRKREEPHACAVT